MLGLLSACAVSKPSDSKSVDAYNNYKNSRHEIFYKEIVVVPAFENSYNIRLSSSSLAKTTLDSLILLKAASVSLNNNYKYFTIVANNSLTSKDMYGNTQLLSCTDLAPKDNENKKDAYEKEQAYKACLREQTNLANFYEGNITIKPSNTKTEKSYNAKEVYDALFEAYLYQKTTYK